MCDLHPHWLAGNLDVLMAPVELIGLARPEQQRDEGRDAVADILALLGRPACGVAPDGIIRTVEPLPEQEVVDPCHSQSVPSGPCLVLDEQLVQPLLERTNPGQRLDRPMIVKRPFGRADRLAHDLPR